MKRKIGIMGGTFNPIHTGHLILGEAALDELSLDEVWYMPAGNPPHKIIAGNIRDEQRVDMVRIAIADNDAFRLSLQEMNPDGYTYTYRTLENLNKENPHTDLYFIMGADSLFDFDTWKEPGRIAAACIIVVATRNHVESKRLKEAVEHLKTVYQAEVRVLDTPNIDLSSHEIREKVAENRSIRYYVPEMVRHYIKENKLYQEL